MLVTDKQESRNPKREKSNSVGLNTWLQSLRSLLASSVLMFVCCLVPPVFWKQKDRFRAQATAWPPAAIAVVMGRLLEAEARGKRGEAPAEILTARALFAVASQASAAKRRAGPRGSTGSHPGSHPGSRRG